MFNRRALAVTGVILLAASGALVPDAAARTLLTTPQWLGDIPGLGALAPDPTPADAPINLDGCTISNPLFKSRESSVRKLVPPTYQLGSNAYFGPGVATVIAAVLHCAGASVDGGPAVDTVLSLVAVQVVADSSHGGLVDTAWDLYNQSTLNFLPSSSWYLIAAQTNNPILAGRLDGIGLPVVATDMNRTEDYGAAVKTDSVRAAGDEGAYTLTTETRLPDPFIHNHDWTFWYDRPDHPRAGFFLHLHAMSDSSCGYHLSPVVEAAQPPCQASLSVPRTSPIATVLGADNPGDAGSPAPFICTTPYAFNHPPSHARGYITLLAIPPS